MIKINDILEGKISMNRGGNGYLTSDKLPKDIFIYKNNMNQALHLDDVEVRVFKGKDGKLEGEVIKITNRFKDEFVGTLQVSHRHAFLVPDSIKMPHDLFIPKSKLLDGKDGQKAIGKITTWKEGKGPNGEIIEVLGDAGDNDAEMGSILFECGLERDFPQEVLDEAEAIDGEISEEEISKRWDFRDVTTCVIDPKSARDRDDAISVRTLENGFYQVGIHIADVTHFVKVGGELYNEALNRGTSVYLATNETVPMFPERLSNDICSLHSGSDKLAYSAIFIIDKDGNVKSKEFGRSVINVDYCYSYEGAQDIIELDNPTNKLEESIVVLNTLAKKMRNERMGGSVSFNKKEVNFTLDENGHPIGIILKSSKDSNRLIEEFMLLANRNVGEFINKKNNGVSVNRYHGEPDEERLGDLKRLVEGLGYKLDLNKKENIKSELNRLMSEVEGKVEEEMISTLTVRCMSKAFYSVDKISHWGLGFDYYSHFTSIIRRFSDFLIHLQLTKVLGNNGYPIIMNDSQLKGVSMNKSELSGQCLHLSNCEKAAQKAERASNKFMQVLYLKDKIGITYEGIINSVQTYGIFISIPENGCEGLVKLGEIGDGTWQAEPTKYRVVGTTGKMLCLGDKVFVIITGVNMDRKEVNFKLFK